MIGRRLAVQCTIVAAALLSAFAIPAAAQDARGSRGYNAIFDNLDAILEAYTRMLMRKYDLTDEQAQVTRDMLEGRAREFLGMHEAEIRDAVDRMFDVRLGAEMSPDELMDWGRRVTPLFEDAKKVIVTGNDEFRQLLTDDQRKIHDEDLKLMEQSFATTEQQLTKIVSGEMTVEEFRRGGRPAPSPPPSPPVATAQQPTPVAPPVARGNPPPGNGGAVAGGAQHPGARPPMPGVPDASADVEAPPAGTETTVGEDGNVVTRSPDGEVVQPPVIVQPPRGNRGAEIQPNANRQPDVIVVKAAGREYESEWEKYTREFIVKYNLNDDQTAKANATLKDCQEQADRVMRSRERQIERLDQQIIELKAAGNDKEKAAKVADMEKEKVKLLEPIGEIFERKLKPRLETLPTRAQRKAAEAAAKPAPSKGPEKKGERK